MSTLQDIQTAARNKAKDVFERFEKLTTAYVFAKNKNDTDKMDECNVKEAELLNMLETDEEYDAFDTLFLAEYKELMFDSIHDPTFLSVDYDIFKEYHNFAMRNFDEDYLYDTKHDPTHFVFEGNTKWYSFYHMVEADGKNIFDMLDNNHIEDDE